MRMDKVDGTLIDLFERKHGIIVGKLKKVEMNLGKGRSALLQQINLFRKDQDDTDRKKENEEAKEEKKEEKEKTFKSYAAGTILLAHLDRICAEKDFSTVD